VSDAHLPLGEGAEFDAIRAMLAEWGARATGIGDDAAIVSVPPGEQLVVSTDASVEGIHFRRDWLRPDEIGARATAAALSDLAAMGARPLGIVLALAVPESWLAELSSLARGVGAMAERAGCPVVGGNVTRARDLSLTVTVLGSTAAPLRRSGARVGDVVFVTGRLGGPGMALEAMLDGREPVAAHRARFAAPIPRLDEGRWLVEQGAHAGVDISDGLLADAAHLARASGVRVAIDLPAIPCIEGASSDGAATSGEEYELLVAMPADRAIDRRQFAKRFGVPITPIGVVESEGGEPVIVRGGRVARARGYDHLA
jgi:thiamine-monophosphate kinase